ncbi:MAG TPA: hypothetical protein VNO33_00750, partial [Kofleriaceae bacterium]|nr:hypothetical protein [Kofleriaceae bacterium]
MAPIATTASLVVLLASCGPASPAGSPADSAPSSRPGRAPALDPVSSPDWEADMRRFAAADA